MSFRKLDTVKELHNRPFMTLTVNKKFNFVYVPMIQISMCFFSDGFVSNVLFFDLSDHF